MIVQCVNAGMCPPGTPHPHPVEVEDQAHEPEPAADDVAPILAGKFGIYEDGKGGYWLITETDAHGMQRKHIPAALVKLATGQGLMGKRLTGLFGS